METFSDLVNQVKLSLSTSSYSSTFTDDVIKNAINSAYRWAVLLFPFDDLKKAKKTTTIVNQQYYDYPDDFMTGSIWRVIVDGKKYKKILIEEIFDLTDNNEELKDEYYFADYGRQYFLYPIPKSNGLEIVIWGVSQPDKLVNDSDKTIFYNFNLDGNEAIVKKAVSMLLKRYDLNYAIVEENSAKEILSNIFNLQQKKKTSLNTKEKTFLEVEDFFS